MLGAFIGDIAGSFREFSRNKYPELGLLPSREDVYKHTTSGKTGYGITDDSILTLATMKALLEIDAFPDYSSTATFSAAYKLFGLANRDPIGGYGEGFSKWMRSGGTKPYNSCGNGSAMRISPVGYWGMNPDEVLETAFASAVCTHSHPEGIKGAQATALSIFLARHKDFMGFTSFSDINDHLHTKLIGYDAVEQFDHFDAVCPDTMRLATHILLTTNNFHDAVFKAVTTPRADSDTLGAIVGSIAEPLYGIPDDIADYAKSFIQAPHMDLIKQFDEHCTNR
jgi:ADP-ribosylglycohydrolase